jgi:penicillin amidase
MHAPSQIALLTLLAAMAVTGCTDEDRPDDDGRPDTVAQALIEGVEETERHQLPGLEAPVQVVRTEGSTPHIYAENRRDLARVMGFLTARDRFFMMDLNARSSLGEITEILGQDALENDLESRAIGSRAVAERIAEAASAAPELAEVLDAYAEGVSEWVARAKAGEFPPPSEWAAAGAFVGVEDPTDLLQPWTRRQVAGAMATILYQSSYDGNPRRSTAGRAALDGLFPDGALADLRRAGARQDIADEIRPIHTRVSAPGFETPARPHASTKPAPRQKAHKLTIPPALWAQFSARMARIAGRMRRDIQKGYGSNMWAVDGAHTADGAALMAADGHLDMTVPSILWNLGLDTAVYGGGEVHQLGMTVAGLPFMGLGTNGRVAWAYTQLSGDVTDWYREEVRLGADGRPDAVFFQGDWQRLVAVDEVYVIADVPALGSVGRTETLVRWETADGRRLMGIEGTGARDDTVPGEGEALINMVGDWIVPGDTDDDGVIVGFTMDYGAFEPDSIHLALDGVGLADDVPSFFAAMRGLSATSLSFGAADVNGDIFYGGYQATPCRQYLERDADGRFTEGSDPRLILDGTRYGGFTIPMKDGALDLEAGAEDPYKCVIPLEESPHEISPEQGYMVSCNNDPSGLSLDNELADDRWYIGGAWNNAMRANTISQELEAHIAAGTADLAAMQELQSNDKSPHGELFSGVLTSAITLAQMTAALGAGGPDEERLVALYEPEAEAMDEVATRLTDWAAAGYDAASGVETFYHQPDDQDRKDAVATTLFNSWFGPFLSLIFDDEGLPSIFEGGRYGRVRILKRLLDGRGPENPLGLASWNPDTEESAFFDRLGTDEIERMEELALRSLVDALGFLRSAPTGSGDEGGFGSPDMDRWLWGLRHQAKFESLISAFIGGGSEFSFLSDTFSITTELIPLADDIRPGDPRSRLKWFPRPGDDEGVDANNAGMSGRRFGDNDGPVMRMVVRLKDGAITGENIIPGGQSGYTDSPYFSDQVRLWLANETFPMRFHPADVVEGALGREVYEPAAR